MGAILDQIKWDPQGLIPAVVQDAVSKDVLMLAYMNRESLERTVATGETWFWSRSRSELWHKGATSGHTQSVREIRYDCDADTLLVQVVPNGPACHTGRRHCFYRQLFPQAEDKATGARTEADAAKHPAATENDRGRTVASQERFGILAQLESLIAEREAERPEGAYTTYLFEKGLDKILKKVGEETAETIIAAKNNDNDELRFEVSDLIFHLLVLLRERKLPLDDIIAELTARHVLKPQGKFR
ncbi:MAG TPA: bifunctional phosphoribosyl-AMP cyclohydrolase/phosphoribosyl-ATP diphosphatase HisIE [Bacilli bacterium]